MFNGLKSENERKKKIITLLKECEEKEKNRKL